MATTSRLQIQALRRTTMSRPRQHSKRRLAGDSRTISREWDGEPIEEQDSAGMLAIAHGLDGSAGGRSARR